MSSNSASHLILSLAVLVSLLSGAPLVHAQGTPPPQIRIIPGVAQIPVGASREVAVEVIDVQALYGIDISINFDPNVVEVVDADPDKEGVQVTLSTLLDPGFVVLNRVDNAAGTVRFAMTQLNPSQPKNGTGLLIVVNLRGKVSGASTSLTLTRVDLAQRDGKVFTGALVSGQAQVVAASSGPTPTPFPKQGAGTPMPAISPAAPTLAPAMPAATQRPPTTAPTAVSPTGVVVAPTRMQPGAPSETGGKLPDWVPPLAFIGAGLCFGAIAVVLVIVAIVIPRRRRNT
jgi:Cohesin domain